MAPGADYAKPAAAAPAAPQLLREDETSLLSRVFFMHVAPLISWASKSNRVELAHLPELWPQDRAAELVAADEAYCASFPVRPRLRDRLLRASARQLLQASACRAIYCAAQLAFPMLLQRVVRAVATKDTSSAVLFSCLLALASFTGALAEQQHQARAFRAGLRAKSLVVALVTRHCLAHSASALQGRDPGDISNMLANDAQRFFVYAPNCAQLWSAPAQVTVAAWLLVRLLGPGALAGIGALLFIVPLLTALARRLRTLRSAHLSFSDARVRLTAEAARGMRGLKFLGFDQPFLQRILGSRRREQQYVRAELQCTAFSIAVTIVLPVVATAITFAAACVPSNKPLAAAEAFAALSLFGVLRFPLMGVGEAVAGAAQVVVSISRLDALLAAEECVPPPGEAAAAEADKGVSCTDARFWWPPPPPADGSPAPPPLFALSVPRLRVAPGQLVCIIGPVGCGKSTLLAGLLGEAMRVPEAAGAPALLSPPASSQRVAYVSQAAWLLNATLRENVVFGRPWSAARYAAALAACSLASDIRTLPARDETVLGERGVTLSGGQKARLSLARALYGDPDVLLLDDPLSALDADTGRAVFGQALGPGGMASRAARVLVTHATQYLSAADAVAILDGGALVACAPLAELRARAAELPAGAREQLEAVATQEEAAAATAARRASLELARVGEAEAEASDAARNAAGADGRLEEAEEQGMRAASWATVKAYILACGGRRWAAAQLLLLLAERLTYLSTDYMLTTWTSAQFGPPDTVFGRFMRGPSAAQAGPVHGSRSAAAFYAGAYLLCCAVNAVFAVTRTQWFCAGGAAAAGRVFERAASAVLRAPLLFFETTPTGRILNRLTGDQDVLDTTLPVVFLRLTASMSWALSALAVMCGVVPPAALVCGLGIAAYAVGISRFAAAYAQLQRLDANTRSPLQVHVQESLSGAHIIRAAGAAARFVDGCDARCDASARATAAFTLAGRCFAVRLETLGACVLLSVGVSCSLLAQSVGAPLAGLALLWGTNFTTSLSFFTQSLTDFQSKIVSVERLLAYAELRPEPQWDEEEDGKATPAAPHELAATTLRRARVEAEAPAGWPSVGALAFEHVTLCYRPGLPPALRDLSFHVRPGERLGIVGRTGAGKSTIAAALLRLRELSGGRVVLDGIDLSTLPLATVRGRAVCALPQEPLLLTGSVRDNLLLTRGAGEAAAGDAEVWVALEAVRMRAAVARLPAGLDAAMADAGANFSAGERQLLCFARALLRNPRVLLLDEATASTDEASDAAIQQALRSGFGSVTVMAIAHRIGTIIDYDTTLVMSAGQLAELGPPAQLLADEGSAFSALVKSMGPAAAAALREAAAAAAAETSNQEA